LSGIFDRSNFYVYRFSNFQNVFGSVNSGQLENENKKGQGHRFDRQEKRPEQ
jgi:hypothetical protein